MTDAIMIVAHGKPIQQGSKSKSRWGAIIDDNAKTLKPWRRTVTAAAQHAMRYHEQLTGPVRANLLFCFARPKSHYRTGRNAHLLRDNAPRFPISRYTYGDSDKLVRAIFDALTDAGVWVDDAQVVDHRARTVYAGEHERALERPGVIIQLEPALQLEGALL